MDAHVSVLQNVQIEHTGSNDITVLSATPGVRGEEVTVRIGPSDAVQMTLVGRMVSSEPCMGEGRVMHRVKLTMTGSIALSSGVSGATNSWRSGDRSTAVFVRRYPTRVVNLSRGGALLELSTGLPVGTVATLHSGDRIAHAEPVRIDFLQARRGVSWPYAAGIEFLSLAAPSSYSLRSMAARIESEQAGPSLATLGEESGLRLTNPVPSPFDILSIVCAEASTFESPHAPARSTDVQPKPGRPLALVGRRTTTPSAHETFGDDD